MAATTVGLAVVSNSVRLGADPNFGTTNSILTLNGSDANLAADLAALEHRFGTMDVVAHQTLAVPGSVSPVDLRAENPSGSQRGVRLRLDAGRYPIGAHQVAMTRDVTQLLDLHVGSVWQEGGRTLQVVGLVENPLNLLDQFALVALGQANPPGSVSILLDGSQSQLESFNLPSGTGLNVGSRGTANKTAAEALVLVMATIGLLFVGLLRWRASR